MSEAFDAAFAYTLVNEGTEFSQHVSDRGGATRYGITLATLRAFRGSDLGADAVRALTLADAKDIYRQLFWAPLRFDGPAIGAAPTSEDPLQDSVPAPIATALFDVAVLCGAHRATKMAQRALVLNVDGRLGPLTSAALRRVAPAAFIPRFVPPLTEHFVAIVRYDQTQMCFLDIWMRRAMRLLSLTQPPLVVPEIPKTV